GHRGRGRGRRRPPGGRTHGRRREPPSGARRARGRHRSAGPRTGRAVTLRRILGLAAGRPGWLVAGAGVEAVPVIAQPALGPSSLLSGGGVFTIAPGAPRVTPPGGGGALARGVPGYRDGMVSPAGPSGARADAGSCFSPSMEPLAPARLRPPRWGALLARITA